MKGKLVAATVFALGLLSLPAKSRWPMVDAKEHLEHAHSEITKAEAAGDKQKKGAIAAIINILNNAEVSLTESANNKGSNTNVALKFVADAKDELEAAKNKDRAAHLAKAEKAVDEALKRVMQANRVHHAKS